MAVREGTRAEATRGRAFDEATPVRAEGSGATNASSSTTPEKSPGDSDPPEILKAARVKGVPRDKVSVNSATKSCKFENRQVFSIES
jgi:hypothetical protein